MDSPIMKILIIVAALGLFGFTILPKVSASQDISVKTDIEFNKIDRLLEDSNTVLGSTVRSYHRRSGEYAVSIKDERGSRQDIDNVKDNALYKVTKEYNANGHLSHIVFNQIDLSETK